MPVSFHGSLPLISITDLQNLVSDANRAGDARAQSANSLNTVTPGAQGSGIGKRKGTLVAVDIGSGAIAMARANGPLSSDLWRLVDGTTAYTPVNILNRGGGAAWTLTTATYAAGVLTASTAAAINATQTVTLKAGRYKLSGTVGRRLSTIWPRLIITYVPTSTVLLSKEYSTATVSAASTVVDKLDDVFTVPLDGAVKFDLNVRDGAGNQTGATWIDFILEANG